MKAIIIAGLLTVSTAASAAALPDPIMSGDWGRGINADGSHYALTINASKSALGQICSSEGNCGYIVRDSTTCSDGEKYAGMINAVTRVGHLGANPVTLVCSENRLLIKEFDVIDHAVRNASSLGIVTGLQDGTFAVSRFSLTGSARAVDGMRAAAQRIDQAPVAQSRPADIRI